MAYCQTASPDCLALILLDVKMPVLTGFQFLEQYAQLPLVQHRAIIIVLLTTSLNHGICSGCKNSS